MAVILGTAFRSSIWCEGRSTTPKTRQNRVCAAVLLLLGTSSTWFAEAMVMSRTQFPDRALKTVTESRVKRKMCGKHACWVNKDQFKLEHESREQEVKNWLARGLEGWFLNRTWNEDDAFRMCQDSYEEYQDVVALDEDLYREKYATLESLTRKASQKEILREHGVNQMRFERPPQSDGFDATVFKARAEYYNQDKGNGTSALDQQQSSDTFFSAQNETTQFIALLENITHPDTLRNYPAGLILKPSDGTNSIGVLWVQMLSDKEAVDAYWQHPAREGMPQREGKEGEPAFRTFAFYGNLDHFWPTWEDMVEHVVGSHLPHYHEYMQRTVWENPLRKGRWFVEKKVPVSNHPPVSWTHRALLTAETSPIEIRVNVMCREILGFWISIEGNEFDNCVHKKGDFNVVNPEIWTVLARNWGGFDKNPRKQFEKLFEDVANLYMEVHPVELGNIPMMRFDFFAHPQDEKGLWHTYNEGIYGIAAHLLRPYESRVQAWMDEKNGHNRGTLLGQKRPQAEGQSAQGKNAEAVADTERLTSFPLKHFGNKLDVSPLEWQQAQKEAETAKNREVVLDEEARVSYIDDFASAEEMAAMRGVAMPQLDPGRSGKKTGKVAEIDFDAHPLLRQVELRKHALIGLDNHMPGTTRVRRYGPGDGHPVHTDWWDSFVNPARPSNLIATLHLFMSDVAVGGGTDFPHIQREVSPKAGRLAIWWSCDRDGQILQRSEHEGKPVVEGIKWTSTTFIYNYMDRCIPYDGTMYYSLVCTVTQLLSRTRPFHPWNGYIHSFIRLIRRGRPKRCCCGYSAKIQRGQGTKKQIAEQSRRTQGAQRRCRCGSSKDCSGREGCSCSKYKCL
ncbi:unnamed protein product [Amoebophrya sp. A25]|nr:unnamed protein product [Amoebophrya sp. A25]|eukprot:GSA25T00023050001.1